MHMRALLTVTETFPPLIWTSKRFVGARSRSDIKTSLVPVLYSHFCGYFIQNRQGREGYASAEFIALAVDHQLEQSTLAVVGRPRPAEHFCSPRNTLSAH